ncbi:MAG: hypothetical protein KJZ80_11135 [Hyphomicrobiaceae bacterium]|nr:hypothetical protein [Hyphomicrobiaceae bacterium]
MNRQPVAAFMLLVFLAGSLAAAEEAAADDPWRPFSDPGGAQRRAPPAEPRPTALPQMGNLHAPVERAELPPVMAGDGSGLPLEPWTGLDLATAEQLMTGLDLPPLSPALSGLWRRLLTASTSEPAGSTPLQFTAVRAEALYRSGQLEALGDLLSRSGRAESDPLLAALSARHGIAVGRRDAGCSSVRSSAARKQELPPQLRREMLVLAGYCAAAAGNVSAAALAGELAREEGLADAALLDALDALAAGRPPRPMRKGLVTPTHFRLLQLAKAADPALVPENADAALIAALALDPAAGERMRVGAAEAAARRNVVAPEALAEAYRAVRFAPAELADPLAARTDPDLGRALMFQAAEAERHPMRRARVLRAFLDDARRAGFYFHALAAAAPIAAAVPRSAELAWFGEIAVEAALASGDHGSARAWAASLGHARGGRLDHWLALSDIADAGFSGPRGAYLPAVEELALRGRFSAPFLHRLATVLDALDYQVPMALWQAASSTPQPNDGYLPETGILTQLHDASSRKEYARTVLLAMHALGPKGAEGAHIIALGDVIRALGRIGLGADARRIGFEALFSAWPRSASQ